MSLVGTILACGTVGTIIAYVDTVYIEQADVFLLGIGMYSCLEWVDVWVLVAPYWQSIGSLLAVYCPPIARSLYSSESGQITLSYSGISL